MFATPTRKASTDSSLSLKSCMRKGASSSAEEHPHLSMPNYHRKHSSEHSGQATPTRAPRWRHRPANSAPTTPQNDQFRVSKHASSPTVSDLRKRLSNVVISRFSGGKPSSSRPPDSRVSSPTPQGPHQRCASELPRVRRPRISRHSSVQASNSTTDDEHTDDVFRPSRIARPPLPGRSKSIGAVLNDPSHEADLGMRRPHSLALTMGSSFEHTRAIQLLDCASHSDGFHDRHKRLTET